MSTTDICRRTRKVSLMLLALNSLKLSAQSPPWRRNDRPTAASARRSSRVRASPAKTMGGNASTVRSTSSSSALSGYSGYSSAGRPPPAPHRPPAGGLWRRAHSPDTEKRPAGARPPAKDANWLEEDLGRGAEWRERGEWICGGRGGWEVLGLTRQLL